MQLETNNFEKFIKTSHLELLKKYKHLSFLLSTINNKNNLYIFGGWLRDILHNYIHNDNVLWQDVDIIVDGEISEKSLPVYTKSNFGGYRFNFARNKKVDFWELKETFAFKKNIISVSLENIIKTTVFTVNGLLFDLKDYKLIGMDAIEDIIKKRLNFNCKDYLNYFPELQVYRAYLYSEKLGYTINQEIIEFSNNIIKEKSEAEFLKLILKHKSWVSVEEIEQLYSFYRNIQG